MFASSILALFIAIVSGLLGGGGPVFAVPVLVMVGVPLLTAAATAQVQSIFIATFATAGISYKITCRRPSQ